MGRNRYPRRGHRIAPATLREILQSPVPAKYLSRPEDASLRLCDLDETAWERFDEPVCRALAGEVLSAVGRAARMPLSIGDRTLPPLPAGVKLSDLELEVRTVNCLVAAGIHERPQDLQALRIEGLLSLRGFWVKCLVDLLTSLEHVIDHPEARRALRDRAPGVLDAPRVSGHYPRPGFRLAPESLREILSEPVPEDLVSGTTFEGKRLFELSEEVWDCLSGESIRRLSELIVSRVNMSGYNRLIQERPIPKPPKGVRLEDLRLENRTYNCLRREGFAHNPDELGQRTVGRLLSIKAFGAKCLVDLLTCLETLAAREGKLDEKLLHEAQALAAIPDAAAIDFNDPRLGPLLRATDSQANTVAELVRHVLERRVETPDPLRLYEQIAEVRRRIEQLSTLPLEEELIQIFSPTASGRDRQIVAEYYGWDGSGRHTLEQLGQKYELSRERIRQVCIRAVKRSRRTQVYSPVLDRVLAFITDRLPASTDKLLDELQAAGLSHRRLSLDAVREAAQFLGREPGFALVAVGDGQLAVPPVSAALPRAIIQAAKRAVLSYGATTIADVATEIHDQMDGKVDHGLIEETLSTLDDFRWLDRKRGWFQLESMPQYGLPNMVEKILSVTGRIDVMKLRGAIARYRRSGRKVPPAGVLLEFCRQMPGIRVEGSTIVADPPRDWREVLSGVEAGMVQILEEHGPVLERSAFEEHCIRQGMNRFSFNAIIMCSPIIAQYGRSVYGLLGAKIDRRTIDSLTSRRPAGGPAKVLYDFGETDTGQAYLIYRLSKAAISGGVVTVPAAMKERLEGRFSIRTADGADCGTLVAKSGCAWGLGPVLRSQQAKPGEYLVILFDLSDHEALVRIGGEELLDTPIHHEQAAM